MPTVFCPGCGRKIVLAPAEMSELIVCAKCEKLFCPARPETMRPAPSPIAATPPAESPPESTLPSDPRPRRRKSRRRVTPLATAILIVFFLLLTVGSGTWLLTRSKAPAGKVEPKPVTTGPVAALKPASNEPIKALPPSQPVEDPTDQSPPALEREKPSPKAPIASWPVPATKPIPEPKPLPPAEPARLRPGEWEEFTSLEGRFRVRMPARPATVGPPPIQGQAARVGGLGLFTPERDFYALAGELDEPLPSGGRLGYLPELIRDSLAEKYDGILKSQKDVTVGGRVGKEFTVIVPGQAHARVRIFFVGTRYVLQGVAGPQAAPPEKDVARFFGSLRLTD